LPEEASKSRSLTNETEEGERYGYSVRPLRTFSSFEQERPPSKPLLLPLNPVTKTDRISFTNPAIN
jgi:hypothetical protein